MVGKPGIYKIKINGAGIQALLRDPGVVADLEARGERIAAAAGEGMETDTVQGKDRTSVFIRTETREARLAEAEDRALSRAIDAGR